MTSWTRSEFGDVLLTFASEGPRLALRFGRMYLRFLGRRRRGVRAFRKALIAGGMPTPLAARLATAYHEAASLPRALAGLRSRRSEI